MSDVYLLRVAVCLDSPPSFIGCVLISFSSLSLVRLFVLCLPPGAVTRPRPCPPANMLTLDGRSGPFVGTKAALMNDSMDLAIPASKLQLPMPAPRHMWIVTGPAGCGKSTVAAYLAKKLSIPFIEGDNVRVSLSQPSSCPCTLLTNHLQLHPPANRAKMEAGIPLNDEDRWDWLVQIREAAVAALDTADSETTAARRSLSSSNPKNMRALPAAHRGVVITCSALKHKYRDVIRVAAYNDHRVNVHFIYLHAPEEVLTERVRCRKGHFMAATMVHSQFAALEEPDRSECRKDVLFVDCSGNAEDVERDVMQKVQSVLMAPAN